MRFTVLAIAALIGLSGSQAITAGDITVFIARQNIDQDLKQDEKVRPGTRIQTRAGGLVVLFESETVTLATEDSNRLDCHYWTVIPANTAHVVRSSKGNGCGDDTRVLDRALASAESGEGQLMHAAFRVVQLPALTKGDSPGTASEATASRFEAALREIPQDPPKPKGPKGGLIQPGLNLPPIEMKIHDADASRIAAEAARQAALEAALEKEKAAKTAGKMQEEAEIRAAREAERRRSLGDAGKGSSGKKGRRSSVDPDKVPAGRQVGVAIAVIKGASIDDLSAETGLPPETIKDWYTRFVAGGQASLEGTMPNECEESVSELREKLGEMLMENGRLRERCG